MRPPARNQKTSLLWVLDGGLGWAGVVAETMQKRPSWTSLALPQEADSGPTKNRSIVLLTLAPGATSRHLEEIADELQEVLDDLEAEKKQPEESAEKPYQTHQAHQGYRRCS